MKDTLAAILSSPVTPYPRGRTQFSGHFLGLVLTTHTRGHRDSGTSANGGYQL